MADTQQVNLRLSPQHAELVRLFVQRLREGGPSYEREIRLFLLPPYKPHYMTIEELDRRFGEILRRIEALETRGDEGPDPHRSTAEDSSLRRALLGTE